jgi:hypothetical protein
MAVLPDATEALEVAVPSYEATEDPREASDAFLGVSAVFPRAWAEGFLRKPLMDGRLAGGRGARLFEADLAIGTSGAGLPGLGVLTRGTASALGGGIPNMDARTGFAGVFFADGVWND